jgi:ATP phosphoribosyltransferase
VTDTFRVAVPSKGRLRDDVVDLLSTAGYRVGGLRGRGSMVRIGELDLIGMRPRDSAEALAAGALDGAFIATDIALEAGVGDLTRLQLGTSRSTLVIAVREDADIDQVSDLEGGVVATHMPHITGRYLSEAGVNARVLAMGGSLEGLCASGLADAIVDSTETGTSLRQNNLRILATLSECEAEFAHRSDIPALTDLEYRIEAALRAREHRYVMLHLAPHLVNELAAVFSGLASPTVLPLAGRDDLVAAHFVVRSTDFWDRLGLLRDMGATGIVALQPDALAP